MAQLIIVEGENRGKAFDLNRARETVGSAPSNTIVLTDRRISPNHAEITRRKHGYEIKNLDHSKALQVNGEVFRTTRLQHGDWITIADTTFVFSEDTEHQAEQIELQSIDTDALLRSQIHTRRKSFEDAESVIESLDRSKSADQRLKVLFRLASRLSSTLVLRRLGDKLAEEVLEIFDADRVFVLTMEEDQKRLRPLASRTRDSVESGTDISRTIIKEVLTTKEAVISSDAMDDARFLSGQSIVDSNVRSFMCVPCIHQSRVVALIQVDSSTEKSFGGDDLDLLNGVAQFVAVLIENCKAYQKGREYNQQLFHLGRAIQRLSSFLDRETILKEVGKIACQQLSCTKASVILVTEEGRLRLESVQGMTKDVWGTIRGTDIGDRFCRRVMEEARPLLVQDIRELGYTPNPRYSTRSFLIVPIVSKVQTNMGRRAGGNEGATRVLGTIAVTDKMSGSSFSGNDQKILDILAGQLAIALKNAELYEKATVDSLTRVYLRRYFEQQLQERMDEVLSGANSPLSLLILDLDHFKHTNDTYGHQAGDEVLKTLGALLKKCVRPATDTVARYGGEEFTVLLPGADAALAEKVAERILHAVEAEQFKIGDGREIHKTCSIGIATVMPGERETPSRLLKKADYALYEAKESGRNRLVSWTDELLAKLRKNASARNKKYGSAD
ncbi:MAG: diguanylate cyclase [Planctomycetota bacterium]